jgi:ribokinase
VVNEVEARELFGLDGDLDAASFAGLTPGCDLVVTLGARGAALVPAEGEAVMVPAYAVDAVDTVGAGDAFVGGLSAELAASATLEQAVRTGSAAGALTATVVGARHPSLGRDDVDRLLGGPR